MLHIISLSILALLGYNRIKVGERKNGFLSLTINSRINIWEGGVTDGQVLFFMVRAKDLGARENLLTIHCISSILWVTSAQSSAKKRSWTVCNIDLGLALKLCWLNNSELVLNSNHTPLTFSNTVYDMTEKYKSRIQERYKYTTFVLFPYWQWMGLLSTHWV